MDSPQSDLGKLWNGILYAQYTVFCFSQWKNIALVRLEFLGRLCINFNFQNVPLNLLLSGFASNNFILVNWDFS